MTEIPPLTVTGPHGAVPLLDVFEGRRMLMVYFHMWNDGKPFEQQCEGCTFSTCHMQVLDYLHARGVTYAVFSQGPYDESAAFRRFMGYSWPWYSTKDSDPALVDGRGFGVIALLPAPRRPGIRDLLDHRARRRGSNDELPRPGPDRVWTAGAPGRLPQRMARLARVKVRGASTVGPLRSGRTQESR